MPEYADKDRSDLLCRALGERILVIDGAVGTELQAAGLGPDDFGGEAFEGCNEYLNLTRPDVIRAVHAAYLEAGADIITTNTFGSSELVLAEYPPLHEQAALITRRGAELARAVAAAYSTPERPRFVAGSMGPTTRAISVTGGVSFQQLVRTYRAQAEALLAGGVDYLLLETCQDTRNVKAGLIGIGQAYAAAGRRAPAAVSGTIEAMGTTLAGQSVEALITSLEHAELLYFGLNCATGPDFMTDHLRAASELARLPLACAPNAGLPDEEGRYLETPAMLTATMARFVREGWLNLVGGCCGTTPAHIRALAAMVRGQAPRVVPTHRRCFVSGLENLEIEDSNRPVIVGERTNVIGSAKFRQLIAAEKYDEAAEIARIQVKNGAQVIDVCLANPDRDELVDMEEFMARVTGKVKVPLMIDSTDPAVIERALTYCQGKAIINSINLEDGEERFARVVPMARRYGAAFVVGTIDEEGMAISRERKLAIARRCYDLLTRRWGVPPSDLIFDPLTFPCATGDAQYLGAATETVEGLRLIKQALPESKTALGISNVSFGLPRAGREVLNSVFLYHCTCAGLDLAIVNAEKLERYAGISAAEKRLAEDVLFATSPESVAAFTAHFRGKAERSPDQARLPLDERLKHYVIEGSKHGLLADLDAKLQQSSPLEIINGPLMQGMDEVGRLFNRNELIVAEVLQSAEVMKAAVAHLEPYMEKAAAVSRGAVLLATVKGDVHDIGKNLVEIILGNNGFKIVNLGIRVAPVDLIQALRTHRPDLVGLSGLLVKSAQQMVITAGEMTAAGVCPPLLVGGAALTEKFVRQKIAPVYGGIVAYARDAMHGLELAAKLIDPVARQELAAKLQAAPQAAAVSVAPPPAPPPAERSAVPVLRQAPQPPDFERHVLPAVPLDEVWTYLNPAMLYSKHLGLRGGRPEDLFARGDDKALRLQAVIDELKAEARRGQMRVSAVWQFCPAASHGNRIDLLEPGSHRVRASFDFARQADGERLCLADYVNPAGEPVDNIGLFVVTAGAGVRPLAERYRAAGHFLLSHAVQALALETAEAAAEWMHARMRRLWGFPDDPALDRSACLQARYRGKRYSFGYPACPDLGLQRRLFDLLRPEDIGVTLTEEDMMDPEASVSALVFHHPAARYFSV